MCGYCYLLHFPFCVQKGIEMALKGWFKHEEACDAACR